MSYRQGRHPAADMSIESCKVIVSNKEGGINLHKQSRKIGVGDEKVATRTVLAELFIKFNAFTFHDRWTGEC